jgi:predicted RNA binding protein YcfA (HicA-like mRNA interferase family)
MKRKEFVRELLRAGCQLARSGARHDLYVNPGNGTKQAVPRHTEISDILAKHIKKHLGIE